MIHTDPCPHLWTPSGATLDGWDPLGDDCPICRLPADSCDCLPFEDRVREADCPAEVGPCGDEYTWCQPDAPEDPDRCWAWRDSGE